MAGPCVVCGSEAELCCSDCGIEQRGFVHVCSTSACRDAHEETVHGQKWDVSTWTMSTADKDLICPCCGHTARPPKAAGDECPECKKAVLESIDPDILKALEPFKPEVQTSNIWMYEKHPIQLPASSSFQMLLKFGEGGAVEPKIDQQIRITLLGQYSGTISLK